MHRVELLARNLVCFTMIAACCSPLAGCVGLVANLMHVAGADLVPAAFRDLSEHRVAVVCVANSEFFGPTSTSSELSRRVNRMLRNKVSKIELVDQQEIENWIDQNDWDGLDFREIGKAVDAEMVVAVDVHSFSLHEGKTMFKGNADFELVVYDMTAGGGTEVFAPPLQQVQYPVSGGVSTLEFSERQFRQRFLDVLAGRVARYFHRFDAKEDFARDADLLMTTN